MPSVTDAPASFSAIADSRICQFACKCALCEETGMANGNVRELAEHHASGQTRDACSACSVHHVSQIEGLHTCTNNGNLEPDIGHCTCGECEQESSTANGATLTMTAIGSPLFSISS
jgi:hypothetical protein